MGASQTHAPDGRAPCLQGGKTTPAELWALMPACLSSPLFDLQIGMRQLDVAVIYQQPYGWVGGGWQRGLTDGGGNAIWLVHTVRSAERLLMGGDVNAPPQQVVNCSQTPITPPSTP